MTEVEGATLNVGGANLWMGVPDLIKRRMAKHKHLSLCVLTLEAV